MRAEGKVNDTDARLWHPWLRINRVSRVMLHTRWSAAAWSRVWVEFMRAPTVQVRFGATKWNSDARSGSRWSAASS
jgi:hypothetical protein